MNKKIMSILRLSLLFCISCTIIFSEIDYLSEIDFKGLKPIHVERLAFTADFHKNQEQLDCFSKFPQLPPTPIQDLISLDEVIKSSVSALTDYYLETPMYTWYDASFYGANQFISGDDTYGSVALPFSFPFYDSTFTTVYISSNGYLSFSDSSPTRYSNPSFPSSISDSIHVIAPFWDDLRAENNIYVWSTSNYVVISYENYDHLGGSLAGTFEVVLFSDGDILFNYQSISNDYGSTVGINYGDGILATTYTYGLSSVTGFSLLFTQKLDKITISGANTHRINQTDHTITWTGFPTHNTTIDHFEVKFDNVSLGNTTNFFWNFVSLTEGKFNVSVHMILNDTTELVDWVIFFVDFTPPTITILSPSYGSILTNKSKIFVSWNATDNFNETMTYYIETMYSTSWQYIGVTSDTSINVQFAISGDYLLRVRGIDFAGNSNSDNISISVEIPSIAVISSHGERLPVELINFYGQYYNIEIIYGKVQFNLLVGKNLIIVPDGAVMDWRPEELEILTDYLRTNGNLLVFSSNPLSNWDTYLRNYGFEFFSGEPYADNLSNDIDITHQLFNGLSDIQIPAGTIYLALSGSARAIGSPTNITSPVLGVYESGERILAISNPLDIFINLINNSRFFLNVIEWAKEDRNHYPSIELNYPNGKEKITQSITINWTANDPDADELTFMLELWNGDAWVLIASDIHTAEFQWDIKNIPDGYKLYKIRITASDGFLTDTDMSDDFFTIKKKISGPPNILNVLIPIMVISGAFLGVGIIYYLKFGKKHQMG